MNIFCILQEYRRKMEEKNRSIASSKHYIEQEKKKGEAK